MKLTSLGQIESLAKVKSENFLTTSFYMNTDKSIQTKKQISLSSKNLLQYGKSQALQMNLSKRKKDSLLLDLEEIQAFCVQNLPSFNFPGMALYSCNSEDFFQALFLPDPPRNRIVFDQNPYVRPLSAILGGHYRIYSLLVDRKEAKWYEIFLGKISLLESLIGDVPSQVREGGWEGYESKRIERHIAAHLHDFFKKVSQITFQLFKTESFDWLFLGCKDEYCLEFESLLHPYLKQRLKARIKANPTASQAAVLKEVLETKQKLKTEEEEQDVRRFVSELEKGGLAVSGLTYCLRKLNRSEVQTLLITRNFTKAGKVCPKCRFLFVDEVRCPGCQVKTETLTDVIDEAVEAAMAKNCQVKHISSSQLDRYGKIGALLRYKT